MRGGANVDSGGLSNFFSLLIESFNFTAQQSLLYGAPGGAVEVIALIANGLLGSYFKNRIFVGIIGMVVSLVGMIMIITIPAQHPGGRLAGYYMTQASPTGFVAILSLISSNVAGYTKKTTIAAMYLIGYCVGNIIGESREGGVGWQSIKLT